MSVAPGGGSKRRCRNAGGSASGTSASVTRTDADAARTEKAAEGSATTPAGPPSAGAAQGAPLQATTSAEAKPEDTKPWKVTANVTQFLGQGTFVKDSFASAADYGYLMSVGASYKVHEKVTVGTRV